MTGGGLLIVVALGWLIWAVIFGKSKSRWYPFGGLIKHDRKTGATSLVFTLPGKRKKGRRR